MELAGDPASLDRRSRGVSLIRALVLGALSLLRELARELRLIPDHPADEPRDHAKERGREEDGVGCVDHGQEDDGAGADPERRPRGRSRCMGAGRVGKDDQGHDRDRQIGRPGEPDRRDRRQHRVGRDRRERPAAPVEHRQRHRSADEQVECQRPLPGLREDHLEDQAEREDDCENPVHGAPIALAKRANALDHDATCGRRARTLNPPSSRAPVLRWPP